MSFVAEYPDEPGKVISGALALAVHALFFILLVVGVSWQRRPPEAMVVDLWNNLPPVAVPKPPEPQPEPTPEVKPPPPPPPPEPQVAKPEPKPPAKTEPQPVKPDIAMKEKLEQEKKVQQQRRIEEEKAREAKQREDEKRKLAAIQADQAREAQDKARLAKEQEDAMRRVQEQQAAAQTKAIDEYMAKIQDKIRRRINKTPCASLGPAAEAQLEVTVLPDGNVLGDPKTRKSSGVGPCDSAIEKAVLKAQPLPVPTDPALFKQFRELNLRFKPNE